MKKIFKKAFFLSSLFLLNSCYGNISAVKKSEENNKFPPDFLWGTATAAYQVEGGITNDWSISGYDAGKATEHFEKYEEDFEIAKKLGSNSYRMSIEWARIEPEEGKFSQEGINFYHKVFKSLKKHGLKPMVTLHHFTNPVWLQNYGGWENEKVIPIFSRFTTLIAKEFGQYTDLWLTFNEPNVYALKCFATGEWPPYKKERQITLHVMNNLLKAHGESYKILHDIDNIDADNDGKPCEVSFAQHLAIMEPYFPFNPADQLMTYFQSKVFNEGFWESALTGKFSIFIPGLKAIDEPVNEKLKGSMDFIGFNYYTRWFIKANGDNVINQKGELTDMKWEIYPEGLSLSIRMADKYAKKLNVPIYITESGINDHNDLKRGKYIVSHTKKVLEEINKGINVKGYMYWSLMDNFEWAEKYEPKFGLLTIDRKVKNSAFIFKELAENNSIPDYLLDAYKIK